jgi:oxygen-dependent protoporphyrinogen oxidase
VTDPPGSLSGDVRADVLVIGGGIAGLVSALDLARAGHRTVLVEASDRFGGVLSAHRVGGLTLDAGAESFATARPAVADLLSELGLSDRIVSPNPAGAWVRHAGGTAPLPAVGLLGIPGRWWAPDVRRVIGIAGAVRSAVDVALPAKTGVPAGATLGELVRRRMGNRVVDRLVEPVAGGVYAADPDRLEVRSVAPGLDAALRETGSLSAAVRRLRGGGERSGSAVATVAGGMHTLVPALVGAARSAGAVLHTGISARSLAAEAAGWRVALSNGGTVIAGAVVLAVPSPAAAELIMTAAPGVPVDLLQTPISRVLICTLVVDDNRLDGAPRGTGVLVSAHASGVTAKALTHATAKWPWLARTAGPGRHVLRLSYGRGTDLPPEAELPAIAVRDAGTLLGVELDSGSVVDTAVVPWTSALPAPRPGHATEVAALRRVLRPMRLFVVGAPVAGSGLSGVVTDARQQAAALPDAPGPVAMIASSFPAATPEPDPEWGRMER